MGQFSRSKILKWAEFWLDATASRAAIQRGIDILFNIGRKQFKCTATKFLAVEEFHTLPKTTESPEFDSHFDQPLLKMIGRCVMQLPQMSGHEGLGTPYDQALYTVQQLEKWLQHQKDVRKNYADFMKEYKDLRHMQLVAEGNEDDDKETIQLPHHPLFKHDSSTIKLRVVFDASAKSTNWALKRRC